MPKKPKAETAKPDDLNVPPWFHLPESFYRDLARYAREFGMTREEFLVESIRAHARELRKRESPVAKALGVRAAEQFRKLRSVASKEWWQDVPAEERRRRAQKAAAGRWKKPAGNEAGEQPKERGGRKRR